FENHHLKPLTAQVNISFNHLKGTLRGLHYQVSPAAEAKCFRCIQGGNYHVIIDMRPQSSTYLQHFGVELTAQNRLSLYVPELFAHGYQAMNDGSEALYWVSEFYTPGCERGIRYDDPAFGIKWPLPISKISQKDAAWSFFKGNSSGPSISNTELSNSQVSNP
ncbi:MAG: dTDP-4-dehydrorhamnose 3,5-epimerase family protein, partial [Cyanobacteria bacterium J06629_9]